MNDVLREIVERTREDLAARDHSQDGELESRAWQRAEQTENNEFARSLRQPGTRIIAEIKSASPSAGVIEESPDVAAIAGDYRDGGAAAISVVTEPHYFHGSRKWIGVARRKSGLPVLMKDFVIDPVQISIAVVAGADALLLLASILSVEEIRSFIRQLETLGRDALVEVHDEEELEKALEAGAGIIGVNNRDLRTFEVDLATAERLAGKIPDSVIRVSESGIRSREDVKRLEGAGYRAFLVGEAIMRAPDRAEMIRELLGDR